MESDSSPFGKGDQRIKRDAGMNGQGRGPAQGTRIYFLDNLRTFMIFLVVVIHTGIVYDGSGGGEYFWIVFDPSTNTLSGILNRIIDLMVMPTLFFVSGFFAPLSLKNEPGWLFLKTPETGVRRAHVSLRRYARRSFRQRFAPRRLQQTQGPKIVSVRPRKSLSRSSMNNPAGPSLHDVRLCWHCSRAMVRLR